MYNYIFKGKLEPENLIVDLNIKAETILRQPDFKIDGRVSINIKRADIKVVYETEINHTLQGFANLETLKNFIREAVELVVNIYGYINSISLDVFILKVECEPLKIDYTFGIKGEHNINKSDEERRKEFNKIFSLFSTKENSPLKDIFSDFHKAIKYPAQTAQFCFRAIETIRTNFYEDSGVKNRKQRRLNGWNKLRTDLGYSKSNFEEIERFGAPNRHGVYPTITYREREIIMNFTRDLIDRFVDKRLRSQKP